MKITQATFIRGLSSFYFDDQQAIKQGAHQDGLFYVGETVTPGFTSVRQAGECVSVLLFLENGSVAVGDCAAVQYSGAGGRDPLFLAADFIPFLERFIRPMLVGLEVDDFLKNSRFFDAVEIDGKRLHTAIRYGLTQALLEAAALASQRMKVEVICAQYGLPLIGQGIALFGQSGDDRYNAVDKMILKTVDVLPHGLINSVPDKLGYHGEKLEAYIRWLVERIAQMGGSTAYKPDLHIDVYGTIGLIFGGDAAKVAHYIAKLEDAAGPLSLYIEGPVDVGSRDGQIEALGAIKSRLKSMGSRVKLVADEWCNTYEDVVAFTDAQCCDMVQIKTPDLGGIHNIVDAILYCNRHGMQAYQGGTCNETDLSARACVHIAMAARPMRLLIKPGMGFDEGMTIVHNEMQRTVAVIKERAQPQRDVGQQEMQHG